MKSGFCHILTAFLLFTACQVSLHAQATSEARDGDPAAPGATAAPAAPAASGDITETSHAPNKGHNDTFVIGNDDVLGINVWKEPDLTHSVAVRSDGKISLPLVGEIQAAGRTPLQLEQDIATKLRAYITQPDVTVTVEKINSQKFNILGRVSKPGSYPLTTTMTVLDAIAVAGGFQEFAREKSIYILRPSPDGHETRYKFNYKDVIRGRKTDENIRLEPRDTIIVP